MTKPIAFIDSGYLSTLSQLGDLGGTILTKLGETYEIHTTDVVINELATSTLSPLVRGWLDNPSNYVRDVTPVTQALFDPEANPRAITRNAGDLSMVEAATANGYRNVIFLQDDGFASKVMTGEQPLIKYIENQKAESFQEIKGNFDQVFNPETFGGQESSIDSLLRLRGEPGISDNTFFRGLDTLVQKNKIYGIEHSLGDAYTRASSTWLGSEGLPDITGAQAIRGFGMLLGAAGLGLAAYDMATSTQKALAQLQSGDTQGALATESDMLGRVLGGFYGAELGMGAGLALAALLFPPGALAELTILAGGLIGAYFGTKAGEIFLDAGRLIGRDIGLALGELLSPLLNVIYDPLILDLNGDGVRTTNLLGSAVYFDYNGNGFAQRTGWVSPNDGILVIDSNGNGTVDGGAELFGSSTQDGFAVLETYDTNGDGVIDASDPVFAKLRVWRDLNSNGASDAGELQTLAEAGINSISLVRQAGSGTDEGNGIGYQASFTREDGTTGIAQTIYFQIDRQDTHGDNTPGFTPAAGTEKLPQLPGSGQINSIAWKMTQDAGFRTDWTALTDAAATMSPDQLRTALEDLLLRWASVDSVETSSRGQYVDARHLAFVEKFFGVAYQEMHAGQQLTTSPSREQFGANIEASFHQITNVMLTAFLAQTAASTIGRGGDLITAIESPYFFYSALQFAKPTGDAPVPETPGNVGAALGLIKAMMPESMGAAAKYLTKAISGLDGMVAVAFNGDRNLYVSTANPMIASIPDRNLRLIAGEIAGGTAALGTDTADIMIQTEGDNVFIGGKGDDLLISGAGSDLFVYSRGDGNDYIRDTSTSTVDKDTLLLTDLVAGDLTFERAGNNLRIKIAGSSDVIISEDFFREWGKEDRGIDSIVFADGTTFNREDIRSRTTTVGNPSAVIDDTAQNDIIHGTNAHELINISGGDDTILYSAGDGFDVINDKSGNSTERDKLVLGDLKPSNVELSRSGEALVIKILSTGEYLVDQHFFYGATDVSAAGGWGIDLIQFAGGVVWNRDAIKAAAIIRGSEFADGLPAYDTSDRYYGGKGNDQISGGAGSDTYVWRKGDGSDAIIDDDNNAAFSDKLVLEDVGPGDVRFSRSGANLLITIRSTGEVITIANQFRDINNIVKDWNNTKYGIEAVQFASGVVWDRKKIMTAISNLGLDVQTNKYKDPVTWIEYGYFQDELGHTGTGVDREFPSPGTMIIGAFDTVLGNGADEQIDGSIGGGSIDGSPGGNYFDGRGGNDFLIGGIGDDGLRGGDGDDILYGDFANFEHDYDGNDSLEGDDGNDTLYGGGGNDYLSGGDGADKLYGGTGSDYLLDDGVARKDVSADDYFDGGKGDDTIVSGDGSDTFAYRKNDGNDFISDSSGSTTDIDKLLLKDIRSDEVELTRSGNDLIIMVRSTNQMIVNTGFFWGSGAAGQGLEQIVFDGGTIWDRDYIREHLVFRGTDSRETIQSDDPNANTFISQKGDDIIISAPVRGVANPGSKNGNDRFIYSRGDGNDLFFDGSHSRDETDTLILTDIKSTEVAGYRSGLDFVLKDLVTGSTLINEGFFWNWETTGQGIDVIQFSDGASWDRTQMRDNAWYRGTVTNDVIVGPDDNDNVFFGGLGDDILVSAYYRGAANGGQANGNDLFIYNLGDGNDLIFDGSHSMVEKDRLQLNGINASDLLLSVNGLDLVIKITTSGQQIIDEGAFWNRSSTGQGLDEILFQDGTLWNREDIRYWAQEGSFFYAGNSSDERLIGSYLNQNLSGNGGNDYIDGKGGSDIIHGDQGNDTLAMSVVNVGDLDQLDGGAGTDTVTFAELAGSVFVDLVANNGEARTSDSSVPATANDRLIATIANTENIVGTAFADVLLADAGDNTLDGGAGDDVMDGRSGNDILLGGAGNDILDGYLGDDQLDGGTGSDTLRGGLGNDTYIYRAGDGADTIFEAVSEGDADTLKLLGITPSAVMFVRDGNTLKITFIGHPDDQLTFANTTNSPLEFDQYGIERIQFEDGTIWDAAILRQKSIYAGATDGNDVLTGTSASGEFGGGKGDDTLNAGSGDDTYVYARGDGNDTIIEDTWNGNDTVRFVDLNPADVSLVRNGIDLTIAVAESAAGAGDGGSVLVKNTLDDYYGRGIERVVFADGTAWTIAQIRQMVVDQAGTAGKDTIIGTNTNDTVTGRGGDDLLNGGGGDDTYVYARGDGNDTIVEDMWNGWSDGLRFTDLNPADVKLVRNGNDLTVVIAESAPGAGDGGSVLIKNTIDDNNGLGIEKIVFADGTTWTIDQIRTMVVHQAGTAGNDTIVGTNVADILTGRGGDDVLNGGARDDTYVYARGDGNDTIVEDMWNGWSDGLRFTDLNPADVKLVRNGNDLTVVIAESAPGAGDGGLVLIKNTIDDNNGLGIEKIVFADGTTWTIDQIRTMVVDQAGTAGNDTIVGTNVSDTLTGRGGDDSLSGGSRDDTYVYARGDGNDTILENEWNGDNDQLMLKDLKPADVKLVRNGNDLKVVVAESALGAGDAGSVLIKNTLDDYYGRGIEKIAFADGTVWKKADWAAIISSAPQTIYGTDGDDHLTGTTGKDTFDSLGGHDYVNGGEGSDTYLYSVNDGDEYIDDEAGSATDIDILKLKDINYGDVTFSRDTSSSNLILTVNSTSHVITLDEQFYSAAEGWGLEKIEFADGVSVGLQHSDEVWSYKGSNGNDHIVGAVWGRQDVFEGGRGNDTLSGEAGSDTYIYSRGDGSDLIYDNAGFTVEQGNTDILRFTDLNLADLTFVRDGNDLKISVNGTSDAITVDRQFQSTEQGWGVEKIEFADASSWNLQDIWQNVPATQSQQTALSAPVLLDLNNDGHIDLRPLDTDALASGSSVTFDWNGDGTRDGTAWVGPQDGFLAIDLSENGQAGADGVIDQAKELAFADWATPEQVATNGGSVSDLDGLRLVFDSNHDNVLDVDDDRWSEFRAWCDANQNGAVDDGELQTMSQAGIKLINLLSTTDGSQSFPDGSAITGTSSYQTTDGTSHYLVGDATLSYQPAISKQNAA